MSKIVDLFKTLFGFSGEQVEIEELSSENIDKVNIPEDMKKAFKESWKFQEGLEATLNKEIKKTSKDKEQKNIQNNPSIDFKSTKNQKDIEIEL